MNEVQSVASNNARRRDKPRMSVSERRQLKKKSSGATLKQIFKTAEDELDKADDDNESVISDVSDAPPVVAVENNKNIEVAKKLSSLEADLARQLSEASNFVAKQCVDSLNEDGTKVQK